MPTFRSGPNTTVTKASHYDTLASFKLTIPSQRTSTDKRLRNFTSPISPCQSLIAYIKMSTDDHRVAQELHQRNAAKRQRSGEASATPLEAGRKRPRTNLAADATPTTVSTTAPVRKRGAIPSRTYSLLMSPPHRPHLPGLHPNIQVLEKFVPGIFEDVVRWYDTAVSEENGYKNETLEGYFLEVKEAADPCARYSEQLPVCLVGDTGVGKSRLMGGFLACHKLATTVSCPIHAPRWLHADLQ